MKQQPFNVAPTRLAPADQASRKDAGVVEHKQVSRPQPRTHFVDRGVHDGIEAAVKHEEPRRAALKRGRLCDELRRKIEIEIDDVHEGRNRHSPRIILDIF